MPSISRLIAAAAFAAVPFTALAQPCGQSAECEQRTQEVDTISLELRFSWRASGAVVLDGAGRLQFPEAGAEPGIYRFELRSKDGRAVYIGETHNLKQRLYQYRTPGKRQPTNHRICAEIRYALASGGRVDVSMAKDARLCAKAGCKEADLASANQRRLLEQLAIFSVPTGVRLLNSERAGAQGNGPAKELFSFCS
jgi:hypothetical protein